MSSGKEINIEIPEGYEIDKERSTFENIILKKREEEVSPEQYFWHLLGDYQVFVDWEQLPGSFFVRNEYGVILMEYSIKSAYLFVHSHKIWANLQRKFSYDHDGIEDLMIKELSKYFYLPYHFSVEPSDETIHEGWNRVSVK